MHTTGLVFAYKVAIKNGKTGYWSTMLTMLIYLIVAFTGSVFISEHLVNDQVWLKVLGILSIFIVVLIVALPFACYRAFKEAHRQLAISK